MRLQPRSGRTGVLTRRDSREFTLSPRVQTERPCEGAVQRRPSACQGESPPQKPTLLDLDLAPAASRTVRKPTSVLFKGPNLRYVAIAAQAD